jgi:menaquinone-specific isochorismate synthase
MKHLKSKIIEKIKKDLVIKKDTSLSRLEIEIDDFDLVAWLTSQKEKTKIYYASRDNGFEAAGIGIAKVILKNDSFDVGCIIDEIKESIGESHSRFYGGISFDLHDDAEPIWGKFGKIFFIAPKIEIIKKKKKTIFAINIFNEYNKNEDVLYSDLIDYLSEVLWDNGNHSPGDYHNLKRVDIPEKKDWIKNLNNAIASFQNKDLKKIVLARKTVLEMDTDIEPLVLFSLLKKENVNTFDYLFQLDKDSAFFGASPELLYARNKKIILSEAIAATNLRGSNSYEEDLNSKALIDSMKNSHEYSYVFESVKSDLEELCDHLEVVSNKKILKLSFLQHIYSRFKGLLKNGISDKEIIDLLHPTPAVAGFPKSQIRKEIKKYENFYRGYYCGPIGYLGKEESEFAVALRCALIDKNNINLFAGAGIVDGSVPEMEWAEVENKIKTFLKIINHSDE